MMPDDTAGDNLDSVAVVHGGNNQRHCSSNAAVHHQFPNFDPSRMCYPPAPPPNDGIQNGNNEIAAIDIKASSLTVGQLAASNAPLCFYAPQQQQQQQQQQPVPQCPSSCNRFIAAQQPPPQQKNLTISLNNARSRGPIGGGGAGALPSTSLDTLDVLAQLDNHPDRQVFVDNLRLIWSEHNIKFRSLPTISKKSIDLYLLYLLVKDRNGFLEVTRKKQWKEVANALGITNCGSAAFGVKRNYSKSGLFFYECRFELNNADPKVVIADYEKQHGTNHSFASAVEGSSSYHTQQQQQRNSPCTAGTGCPSRKRKRTSIPEGGFKSSPESGSAQTPQQSQTVRQPNVNHNSNSMMPKQPPFVPCSSAPSAPMGTSMGNYYPVNTPSSRMMQLDCGTVCQPLTVPPVPSSNNYYMHPQQQQGWVPPSQFRPNDIRFGTVHSVDDPTRQYPVSNHAGLVMTAPQLVQPRMFYPHATLPAHHHHQTNAYPTLQTMQPPPSQLEEHSSDNPVSGPTGPVTQSPPPKVVSLSATEKRTSIIAPMAIARIQPGTHLGHEPINLSRVYMSLKCGLRSEIKWSLEALASLLVIDGNPSPIQYMDLKNLPRLLELIIDLTHKSIDRIVCTSSSNIEETPFDRDFAESCIVTLSLIIRNLSFLPQNFSILASCSGLVQALDWMLGVQFPVVISKSSRDIVTESALVTLANIGGCLRLDPSSINRSLIRRLVVWSSDARVLEAAKDSDPCTNLTGQRLAIECMAKMSVYENNMRLLSQVISDKLLESLLLTLNEWLDEPVGVLFSDKHTLNELSVNMINGILSAEDSPRIKNILSLVALSTLKNRLLKHFVFELSRLVGKSRVDENDFACALKCSKCLVQSLRLANRQEKRRWRRRAMFERLLLNTVSKYPTMPPKLSVSLHECLSLVAQPANTTRPTSFTSSLSFESDGGGDRGGGGAVVSCNSRQRAT